MIKKIITMLITMFVLIGTASAGYNLTLPVKDKEIPIGGETTFAVILTTDPGITNGTLAWEVVDGAPISAKLDGASFASSGEISVDTDTLVPVTYTLTVQTVSGAIVGAVYEVYVSYCKEDTCEDNRVRASATGTVVPTPELSTGILSTVGLLGLFGLVKFSKKN